jgi:hypothetical protein
MVTSDQCRTYANEQKSSEQQRIFPSNVRPQMGISRSWTLLASEMKWLEAVIDEEATTAQQNDFA